MRIGNRSITALRASFQVKSAFEHLCTTFIPLMLSIQDFTVSEPDSDGDMRAEASFAYRNESQDEEELVISGFHLLTGEGLLITSSSDEHEEAVAPGATVELHASSSYFKKVLTGSHKLLLDVVSCRCLYKELGSFEISLGSIGGSSDTVELGEGFLVQGVSISTGSPDDEGDVMLEIKALVRNTSDSYTPRIRLEGRVKGQNGRELEECSTYGDVMMPSETRLLNASTYVKKNRLNGSTIDLRICLFVAATRVRALS